MAAGERPALAPAPVPRALPPVLDSAAFIAWQGLLEARTGIVMPASRREYLSARLHEQMLDSGASELAECQSQLNSQGPSAAQAWADLINRLTVHQTHFFRHQPSFDFIAGSWFAEHAERIGDSSLHAWSIGCGTGEETWTLAMVLDQAIRDSGRIRPFAVCGSDLSPMALQQARRAEYPEARLREFPPQSAARYCVSAGPGRFGIAEGLRQRVEFSPLDVSAGGEAPFARLDLIFCQNVLIYFAPERRMELISRFAKLLAPGGLLVLGPGELHGVPQPGLLRVPSRGLLAFVKQVSG